MESFFGHLISGLIGAMVTGASMTIFIVNRLSRVEARMEQFEAAFQTEKDRTDSRIFELAGMCKEILALGREILRDSADLRTTIKVRLQDERDGRHRG